MGRTRFRSVWLLAAAFILVSGQGAFAQGTIWNGYAGSSSAFLNFAPGAEGANANLHYLGVSLSTGAPGASITLGKGNEWTVDTGSTGIVITSDYLYTAFGIKASDLSQGLPASMPYNSSGLTYTGFYTTLNVGLYSSGSGNVGTLVATVQVPVIVATQVTSAGGGSASFCTDGTGCAPNGISLEQFGIGFGRPIGSSNANPLLNLTALAAGDLQTMAPGYVVTSQGIQLGLTSADVQNTSFSGLLPSASTTSTGLDSAYARAATATDWQTPPMTISISAAKTASANGTFYGKLLVDTGIANMELSTGGAYWNPVYDATNPGQSTRVAVYLPGAASAGSTQPLSYTLIYQGSCASGQGACPPYNAGSDGLSPVYPVNSANAPGDGIAFVTSTATTTAYPYINTGAEFLNYFNIIYDPVSGFFGYQRAVNPTETANNPTLSNSIAFQGSTTIPDGTTVSVPTLLFEEFAQGYDGTYGVQTVAQLSSPGTVTMAGVISSAVICGSNGLNCAATALELTGGRFLFTADNNYLGATAVDAGATLALVGAGSIASSAGVVVNGTLDLSGARRGGTITSLTGGGRVSLGGQTLTISNASSAFSGTLADGGLSGGTGGGLTIAAGRQMLTGTNSYTGTTTIAPGASLLLAGNGSIASSSGVIANGSFDISNTTAGATVGSLAGAGNVVLGGQTLLLNRAADTFAGQINGTGGLAVTGGTETLTGINGYAGGTLVMSGGTLAVNGDSALGAEGGALVLNDGTLMALNNLTTARTILVGGGGGTLNDNGFEISLNGLELASGPVTLSNGVTAINGSLVAPSLAVGSGATLRGSGVINAPTTVAGQLEPGNSPGTLTFTQPVTLTASATTTPAIDGSGTGNGAGSYSRVLVTGSESSFTADGMLVPLLRGISGSATNEFTPTLGQTFGIVEAQGGILGSFTGLAQPQSGSAPGSRFDALYGADTINLVVTPAAYGDLGAAGLAVSRSETTVGSALDAVRPASGLRMTPTQSALFGPLYQLPASAIAPALDELSPSIYSDALVTTRNAWYLATNAVDAQLAARRGLAQDSAANAAVGPGGHVIWMTALAGYNSTDGTSDAPSFTSGLGGAAAGLDVPVGGTGRIGLAVGTVDGQTWTQSGGQSTGTTAQLMTYGQWQSGKVFVTGQLDGLYQQENVSRNLPLFGSSTRGSTNGTAGGGGVRLGLQQQMGAWLFEPSLGFGGFRFQEASLTESGVLGQTIGGQSIASAQSVLGLSLQRRIALSPGVSLLAKSSLGWAHEFADVTGTTWASLSQLGGSGYAVNGAPIGRDAMLVGLVADAKVTSWPMSLFVSYGGVVNGSSAAQSLSGGLRFAW